MGNKLFAVVLSPNTGKTMRVEEVGAEFPEVETAYAHVGDVVFLIGGAGFVSRQWWLCGISVLGTVFCLNFFRDPERHGSQDPLDILSAADGVVTEIVEMEETEFLKTPMRRIGVFMGCSAQPQSTPITFSSISSAHA